MGRPPGIPNKPKTESEPAAPRVRVRSVAVVNRLAHPLGSPSIVIPMKNPDLEIRVVDSLLRAGRIHEMTAKGWEIVEPSDIKGKPEDFGFSVQDGRVVRGERGRDVLMKMHKEDYKSIQLAKSRENLKGIGKAKAKDAVLNDVARVVGDRGDEAATFLNRTLTVTDSRKPEPGLEDDLRPTG